MNKTNKTRGRKSDTTPLEERVCRRGHIGRWVVRKNDQAPACKDCLTLASVKFRAVRGMKTSSSYKPQVEVAISDLVSKQAQIEEQLKQQTRHAEEQLRNIKAEIALLQKQVS
jgi:hypothetical protein